MPNHVSVIIFCQGDWERMQQEGLEELNLEPMKGTNLCSVVAPLPEALQNIVASNEPCRFVHKVTGKIHHGVNGPEKDREQYDRVGLSPDERSLLIDRHGFDNWYDWQSKTWGTKWGTYGLKARQLSGDGLPVLIEFQCAWCPPNESTRELIESHLSEKYCLCDFNWMYFDPASDTIKRIEKQAECV